MSGAEVLITGAGLIGAETARLLSARGQPCTLMDLRPPPAAILKLPGVRFEPGDVTNAAALARAFARPVGAVVHTAAMLSTAIRADPLRGLEVNIQGTARLLEAARRADVARVVQASSATVVYAGFDSLGPAPIPEDTPLRMLSQRPGSLYALTKLAAEQLALIWRADYGLPTVSLRFAAVVGGETGAPSSVPGRLIARLIAAARAGGRHRLDDPLLVWAGTEEFVDPRDCARAVLAALDAAEPAQGVYAVAHPRGWTLPALAQAVADRFGAFTLELPAPPVTGFAGFRHPRPAPTDLSAAARELGFTAAHDLTDSLAHWWPAKGARA
jgi:UDP-glucose 4-epimerase